MEEATWGEQFALAIMFILLIFYVVATIVCFFAYREFKGMIFDAGQGGGFGMGGMMSGGQRGAQQQDGSGSGAQ